MFDSRRLRVVFCKRSFTLPPSGRGLARTMESTPGRQKFHLTKLIMTEICFFGICPITPACVNNATKFGSSAGRILLVARVDKRIGFLNREVGSSFYWSFRMHGARNANAKCNAPRRFVRNM